MRRAQLATSGWGNGYVVNISSTDTGPNRADGWTPTFPGTGESLSSSWNGNWSTNGDNVLVTNVDWNGHLAADSGNSQDIGFVGRQRCLSVARFGHPQWRGVHDDLLVVHRVAAGVGNAVGTVAGNAVGIRVRTGVLT